MHKQNKILFNLVETKLFDDGYDFKEYINLLINLDCNFFQVNIGKKILDFDRDLRIKYGCLFAKNPRIFNNNIINKEGIVTSGKDESYQGTYISIGVLHRTEETE